MRRLKTALRDAGLWFLYGPLRWTTVLLPPRAARLLGAASGRVHALLAGFLGAGRLRANMTSLLGAREADRAWKGYLVQKHQTLLEHFLLSRRGPQVVHRMLGEIRGRERLEEALHGSGGAVLALFHFGNLRMLSALGYEGYPLVQLLNRTAAHAGRGHSARLARRIRDLKVRMDRAMPARFLHWEPGIRAREIYRVPREGSFLLVHLDGSRGSNFSQFEFLGGRAPFATGPARIAHRMKAPMLPVFCVARGDGRHDLVVEAPVDPDGGPESMTAQCVHLLEKWVRRHPEQWWTWARLELAVDDEGRIRMEPRPAAPPERREREVAAGALS